MTAVEFDYDVRLLIQVIRLKDLADATWAVILVADLLGDAKAIPDNFQTFFAMFGDSFRVLWIAVCSAHPQLF